MRKKFFLPAFLCSLFFTAARAQQQYTEADGYKLTVTAERPGAVYTQGEEVRFVVSLDQNGSPAPSGTVQWKITKDTWTPETGGDVRIRDGKAVLAGNVLNEPGFWQCSVRFLTPGGTELRAMAGAGVDPEKIGASMPEPADFMSYWKKEVKKQKKVPMNLRITPVPYDNAPSILVFDVQADCLDGNFSGCIAYPKGTRNGTLPALVTLNGAGVKSSRPWWAAHWAKNGMCVLDFNVHGLPNDRPDVFYQQLEQGELRSYFLFGRDDRNSMFFHEMIMRLLRAIDVIAAQPQWDGKHLMVHGCSQGGAQAVMAGCLDRRVDLVCAEIPAICDQTGMMVGRTCGWPRLVTYTADGKPNGKRLEAARYYDVVNFARHVKVPTYVTAGLIDSVCPPSTVYAMYNQLRGPKEILVHPTTGHIQTLEGENYSRAAMEAYLEKSRKKKN